jgi:hypothetical protein
MQELLVSVIHFQDERKSHRFQLSMRRKEDKI